jgi:hypothetical protein
MSKQRDDFEFAGEPERVEITVRGETRAYYLNDITLNDANALFAAVAGAGEDVEKQVAANRELANKFVAAVVSREDGSRFSIDDVGRMRAPVATKLAQAASKFLSLAGDEPGESPATT